MYMWGEFDVLVVVIVYGFVLGVCDNWVLIGWVCELIRVGYCVFVFD